MTHIEIITQLRNAQEELDLVVDDLEGCEGDLSTVNRAYLDSAIRRLKAADEAIST